MRIYLITNSANGKQYVGQTRYSISARFRGHVRARGGSLISAAIKKYGLTSFTIAELAVAATPEELNKLEEFWIAKLGTLAPCGYNLKYGGGASAHHPDTLRRQKEIEATPEWKTKQRAGINRMLRDDKHRSRLRAQAAEMRKLKHRGRRSGWKWSAEAKARHSEQRKQMWTDPAYRATASRSIAAGKAAAAEKGAKL